MATTQVWTLGGCWDHAAMEKLKRGTKRRKWAIRDLSWASDASGYGACHLIKPAPRGSLFPMTPNLI